MSYPEACKIIAAFKEELECAVEHDLYTTLDTEQSKNLLEALNNVVY